MLCTLAQVKAHLSIPTADTEHDDLITRIITGVSSQLATASGRVFKGRPGLEKQTVVEYVSVLASERRKETIRLSCWPIVSVTEVLEATWNQHASATALVADTDYMVDGHLGELYRIASFWMTGKRVVKVSYTGGYVSAGDTPGENETALPGDLVDAAIQQAAFEYKRKDNLGVSSQSLGDGAVNSYAQDDLLPIVRKTMKSWPYCRVM